jgi:hypothetical protein
LAHDQFALGLAFQLRLEESMVESRRAAELDPLSPQIPVDSIFAPTWQGRYPDARDFTKRSAELDPSFFFLTWASGWIDIQAGRIGDAIPELRKAKIMDSPRFAGAWLGYAYGASGDRLHALGEVDDLRKKALHGPARDYGFLYDGWWPIRQRY